MASGHSLLAFTPQAVEHGTGALDTTPYNHPVYDLALTEFAVVSDVLPRLYDGNGITVYLHYAMSSAVSNDIKLEVAIERIGDQQQNIATGEGFAAAQNSGDITVPGTAGLVDIVAVTFTDGAQMDSLAAGEGFRLKITRSAVAGTDAAGDLELRFVELKET